MSRSARRFALEFVLELLESRSLMSVASTSLSSSVATSDPVGPWDVSSGRTVLVGFKAGLSSNQLNGDLSSVGARLVTYRNDGPSLIAVAPWGDSAKAIQTLSADTSTVRYAQANGTIHVEGTVTPNDPKYSSQWALNFIDAPYAWGITTGSSSTIIAVLDTGLDLRNADLASKVWTNPDTSGADGYPGDLHGWNFVSDNSNIQDNNGHGSNVSGIAAAVTNNGVGIAGLDWNAKIMPVKVLDSQGNGSVDDAISGIYYAVDHGARVINASWGGTENSQALVDALNYANQHNVVFVTAAGNDSSNNDVSPSYPGSYRIANELVVEAIDQSGNVADFSNYGPTTVDVAAPGVNILSTVVGGYASYTGTSQATPFVSATVALLVGQFPNMTAAQLAARVRDTAKPLGSLTGSSLTGGVVDPYFALINRTRGGSGSISGTSIPVLATGSSSPEDVEATILASDAVYQTLGSNPNNFVINTYEALFDRQPSSDELKYHGNAIATGAETRLQLIRQMQGSTEGELTKVARWYQEELGRTDSIPSLKNDSGVSFWADKLAFGLSDNAVQVNILGGDAFYKQVGSTPNKIVQALYHSIFNRDATADEINYNAGRLQNGMSRTDLVNQMLNSTEGRLTTMAKLYSDELQRPGTIPQLKSDSGVAYWAKFLGNV